MWSISNKGDIPYILHEKGDARGNSAMCSEESRVFEASWRPTSTNNDTVANH